MLKSQRGANLKDGDERRGAKEGSVVGGRKVEGGHGRRMC